nr:hypothetical protein [Tanacetum cinerariifolium]
MDAHSGDEEWKLLDVADLVVSFDLEEFDVSGNMFKGLLPYLEELGLSLKEHLDALNSILMDLKNAEVKIKDEDAVLFLLCRCLLRLKVLLAYLLSVKTLSIWKMLDLVCIQESFINKRQIGHQKIYCPKLKEKGLVAATTKDDSCYSGSECLSHIIINGDFPSVVKKANSQALE